MTAFILRIAVVLTALGISAVVAGDALLFDYESQQQNFENAKLLAIVPDHATQGKFSGKIVLDKPFSPHIFFYGGTNFAGKWSAYDQFIIDVFVEGGAVKAGGFIRDASNQGWWERHNYEYKLAPGKRRLTFSLGSLLRSSGKGSLDVSKIEMVALSLQSEDPKSPATIYLDNGRLVKGAGNEVEVAGLKKFDFGPDKSALMPGFSAVSGSTVYTKESGFGWMPVNGKPPGIRDFDMNEMLGRHRPPDDLCRDFAMPYKNTFAVDLPDGAYSVWLMLGPPGNGFGPYFVHRSVSVNGKVVVDQSYDAESFKKFEYAFQDEEDLPGADLWTKYINKLFVPQRFDVEVAGGQLKLDFDSHGSAWSMMIDGLVLWPKASAPKAEQWLTQFAAVRKEQFESLHVEALPTAPSPYMPTEAERARGYATFGFSPEREIEVNSVPTQQELQSQLKESGAPGETVTVCLGVLPLKDCGEITSATCVLKNAGNAAAPEISGRVRVLRYKALNQTSTYRISPKYIDDIAAKPIALQPGITRAFWVTLPIPAGAPAGRYAGELTLKDVAGKPCSVPVEVNVWPIKLAEPDFTMGMFMVGPSTTYLNFDGKGDARWREWKEILEDARDHGQTSLDPGIALPLRKVVNGKADVDFSQMDRFMELARAAGFTRELNGYALNTGLSMKVSEHGHEEAAKRLGAESYAAALKAYFDAIRAHAKEKNWLPICFCSDDEFLIHPGGDPVKLAAQHKVLQESAPDFHFVAFDSVSHEQAPQKKQAWQELLPKIDTWAPSIHGPEEAALVKSSGKRLWLYNIGRDRFTFGAYMFFARQKHGVEGFFQWIYNGGGTYGDYYLASHNESHYGVTFPSTRGLRSTPTWERIRRGVNDHRYLETAWKLIQRSKAEGKGAADATALEQRIQALFAKMRFGKMNADAIAGDGKADVVLSSKNLDSLRAALAEGILKLQAVMP